MMNYTNQFEIGETVVIVDPTHCYNSFSEMAKCLGVFKKFDAGKLPSKNTVYKVLNYTLSVDPSNKVFIYAICETETDKVYLMAEQALQEYVTDYTPARRYNPYNIGDVNLSQGNTKVEIITTTGEIKSGYVREICWNEVVAWKYYDWNLVEHPAILPYGTEIVAVLLDGVMLTMVVNKDTNWRFIAKWKYKNI